MSQSLLHYGRWHTSNDMEPVGARVPESVKVDPLVNSRLCTEPFHQGANVGRLELFTFERGEQRVRTVQPDLLSFLQPGVER